jgi:hypothetical protein
MRSLSARQHLVPGFLDLSEDELAEETRDPMTILASVATAILVGLGATLLLLAVRG